MNNGYYYHSISATDKSDKNAAEIVHGIFGKDVGVMEAIGLYRQIRGDGEIPCNLPLPGIALALLFPPMDEGGRFPGSVYEMDMLSRFAKEICWKTGEVAEHMRRMRRPEFIDLVYTFTKDKIHIITPEEYFAWVDFRISQLSIWARELATLAKRPDARSWIGSILNPRPRPKDRSELVSRFMMGTSFYDTNYLKELEQSAIQLLSAMKENDVFRVPGGRWKYSIGHAAEDVFYVISYIANDVRRNLCLRAIRENADNTLPMDSLSFWLVDEMNNDSLLYKINHRIEEIRRMSEKEKD